jgi:hypothetical protein
MERNWKLYTYNIEYQDVNGTWVVIQHLTYVNFGKCAEAFGKHAELVSTLTSTNERLFFEGIVWGAFSRCHIYGAHTSGYRLWRSYPGTSPVLLIPNHGLIL